MGINVKQNNKYGENSTQFNHSGNENIEINTKVIWKARAAGFLSGILVSIIASYLYDFLKQIQ